MTRRVLADPFVVPAPNGTSMGVAFDAACVDHRVLVEVGDFVGGLYRSALRAWLTDASAAHVNAVLLAQRVSRPLFDTAAAADDKAAVSGSRRDREAAVRERRDAEKTKRGAYRDAFYEFEKAWMRDRKRMLTAEVTSRQAGTVLRAVKSQRDLALRALDQLHDRDTIEIRLIRERLGLQVRSTSRSQRPEQPQGNKRLKGYADRNERHQKQRRLQRLQTRAANTAERVKLASPKVCVGSKRLLKTRRNLDAAGLSEQQWRERWDAARRVLVGSGETGKPGGNDTIRVLPSATLGEYVLQVRLPKHLEHLSNTPGPQAMYQTNSRICFDARNRAEGSRSQKIGEWHERVVNSKAVGYRLSYDTDTRRWVLTAAWTRTKKPRNKPDPDTPPKSSEEPLQAAPGDDAADVAFAKRCFAIDLNAGHIDGFVLDQHGNPVSRPIVYQIPQQGTSKQRQSRVCETLHRLCREHLLHADINHVAIEHLDFADIAAQGRNRPARRGAAGRGTRRKTLGIPTAKFTYHAAAIFNSYNIGVVAVDPAYTTRWGARIWQPALDSSRKQSGTRRSASSVVIGRRSQGHGPRRAPGIHRNDKSRKARSGTHATKVCSNGQDPANAANPKRGQDRTAGMPARNGNDEPERHHSARKDSSASTAKDRTGRSKPFKQAATDDTNIYQT